MMRSEIDTCTEAIEAGTIRKIRTRILPFLFLLYIICFLDRINIGFAALTMKQGTGDHQPAVRSARRDLLFRLLALWSS